MDATTAEENHRREEETEGGALHRLDVRFY